jgi:hypothetical protein
MRGLSALDRFPGEVWGEPVSIQSRVGGTFCARSRLRREKSACCAGRPQPDIRQVARGSAGRADASASDRGGRLSRIARSDRLRIFCRHELSVRWLHFCGSLGTRQRLLDRLDGAQPKAGTRRHLGSTSGTCLDSILLARTFWCCHEELVGRAHESHHRSVTVGGIVDPCKAAGGSPGQQQVDNLTALFSSNVPLDGMMRIRYSESVKSRQFLRSAHRCPRCGLRGCSRGPCSLCVVQGKEPP